MPITNILEKLRSSQKTRREQKIADSQNAASDEAKTKLLAYCKPCNGAITDVTTHFKNLVTNIEAVRKMREDRSGLITMEDGIRYTIDDINAKIYREECWIEYHLERYGKCCKEGKLPDVEKFKC